MSQESNEIVRADPVYRKRALLILLALAIVVGVASLIVDDPVGAWFDHIRSVSKTDAADAERLFERTTWAVMIFVGSIGASAFTVAASFGRKLWKAERWPPIGARLLHDTHVIRGKRLRILATVLFSLGVVVFATALYTTWKFSVVLSQAR